MIRVVDEYTRFNGATESVTVTPSLMAANTVGLQNSSSNFTTPVSVMATGPHQATPWWDFSVDGITYSPATSATDKSISYDHNTQRQKIENSVPAGYKTICWSAFITLGPPNLTDDLRYYDFAGIERANGTFAALQLRTGNVGYNYAMNIETNPGGATSHGNEVFLSPSTTYWFDFYANSTTGASSCKVWSLAGTLVGTMIAVPMDATNNDIVNTFYGNNEASVVNNTSYFQSIVRTWTRDVTSQGPSAYLLTATSATVGNLILS